MVEGFYTPPPLVVRPLKNLLFCVFPLIDRTFFIQHVLWQDWFNDHWSTIQFSGTGIKKYFFYKKLRFQCDLVLVFFFSTFCRKKQHHREKSLDRQYSQKAIKKYKIDETKLMKKVLKCLFFFFSKAYIKTILNLMIWISENN